ncbi:MAG: hypothetical protein JWR72_4031 [Flavisolibacter sp.]|jgi:hypothetical protein|nr:hypothetical protein [Flavisolibacter sp.]
MDNSLQNKLTRFEEIPPTGIWDRIAEALDNEGNFANRLYNYTQDPPLTVWNSIEKSLDADATHSTKVIPFTTRFKTPIRYVAAASIVGIIAISTTLLMKRTEAGALQTGSETTVPVKESPDTKKEGSVVSNENNVQAAVSPRSRDFSPESQSIQESQTVTTRRKFSSFVVPQNIAHSFAVLGRFIPKTAASTQVSDFAAANNYMVYCDGDGNAMKLPKKLFSLVSCQDGDGSCKERIYQLQQKLSSPAITADFTGVLEILHQLQ